MDEGDDNFVKCLSISPNARSIKDIQCIRAHFKTIEALKSFKELTISEFSRIARYEKYEPNSILYHYGDVCTSWYIVLSGCVLVGQTMFFPRFSFGHRSQGNLYRYDECVILEKTELIVFDYSLERHTQPTTMTRKLSANTGSIKEMEMTNNSSTTLSALLSNTSYNNGLISKRSSHASDTSSAYSGCDVLSGNSFGNASYASDNEDDDEDLDSLSQDIYSISDTFYDVILKDPSLRTESDIETILDGVQNLPAFMNCTSKTKYELCKVMRVAMVQSPDEKLMDDGQLLDTWNVVLNGTVEVRHKDGSVQEYNRGTSFGVRPTMEEQKQVGEMWTVSQTCLFCCVLQKEFCDIMSRNKDGIIPEFEDSGKIDVVYEERKVSPDSSKTGKIVVKGTADKLISILMTNQLKTDPMYIENFLLTYRVFIKSPKVIADKFCKCYDAEPPDIDTKTKATIRKCLILWANNHFVDLDDPNSDMAEYLEKFESIFSDGHYSIGREKSLFFLACSSNSKSRYITLDVDKNFMVNLPFLLIGLQKGWGLFIKEVNRLTVKKNYGLRRGDQILILANHSWERIETLDKAADLLNSHSNRSIELVVRYNPSEFHEIIDYLSDCESGIECESPKSEALAMSNNVTLHGLSDHVRNGLNCIITPMAIPRPNEFIASSPPSKLKANPRSANASPTRMNRVKQQKYSSSIERDKLLYNSKHSNSNTLTNRSTSNPDLKALVESVADQSFKDNLTHVGQVLKVYRPNLSEGKLVSITNNTTAKEVVPLMMKEFSIDLSEVNNYSLYMVTVENGQNNPLVKSSRVALYFKDLAGKLGLNQRFYLKNNQTDTQLITDEQVKTLLNESKVTLSQLRAVEIATRLTLIDYALFRDIQAAEYINFIFGLSPLNECEKSTDSSSPSLDSSTNNLEGFSNGYENYKKFEHLINRESFWPTTEICLEPNVNKRAELIKKFIKVAKICKDLKNFNSLMCIMTGLNLSPVGRLKSSWDKVPSKSIKMYEDLNCLLDMSFNFRQIRQLVSPEISEPPLIPCLALHSKDLAAIHLGNKTSTKDGLINFEKLRMMASEVRKLIRMCNTAYNLQSILSSVRNRNTIRANPQPSISNFNHSMDESDATSGISGCSNNSDNYIKKTRSNSVDQFALNRTLKKKNIKRKSINVSDNSTKTPKKIYEEWLATLKVRTYLSNLQVEMNINHLQDLSQSLEPSGQLSVPPTISSTATSDNQTNEQATDNCKTSTPKSSITINLSQAKPVTTTPPIATITVSTSSSQSIAVTNPKQKCRPNSIFSFQNQDDIDKMMMELVSSTKRVPRKQQLTPDNGSGVKARYGNPARDQSYLNNLPLYNNNSDFLKELSHKTQMRKDRISSPYVPGGITMSLQQSHVMQLDNRANYCYPTADIPFNNVYYADRKKCMKPDLPSYETARAISQHQKITNVPYHTGNNKSNSNHISSPIIANEISSSRPPQYPSKPPKLPSYDQHLSRTLPLPQEMVLQTAPKRNIPPPPPRTVTMLKSSVITSSPLSNKPNSKEFKGKYFHSLEEFEEIIQL